MLGSYKGPYVHVEPVAQPALCRKILIEKTIQLEIISLTDFLGVESKNIRELAAQFPTGKIISRGNTLKIKGSVEVVEKIEATLQKLLAHYHDHGVITQELVHQYVNQEDPLPTPSRRGTIMHGSKGRLVKPRTINQEKIVSAMAQHALAFVIGPAGTGKTYISVALALQALKNKEVKKIIITRPIVEAGENLGFLPGYLEEKTGPYLHPIYDALEDMLSVEKRKHYQEQGLIEIAPLAYMRGRTLHDAFVILDEAQNTTATQMKMFLTRMGPHAKFIITGDTTQIDLPRREVSGLVEAIEVLSDTPGVAFFYLDEQDVVRHTLVQRIIRAYEQHQK